MRQLLAFEIFKLIRLPRVWITFGVMAIIMALINFGVATEGREVFDLILKPLSKQFIIKGNIINGNLLAYIALNMLWVHIPVLLVIVTADLISGEFESGTIRNVLCSKHSRVQYLLAKIITAGIYILMFMAFSGVVMLIPARIILGNGDLVVFFDGMQILSKHLFSSRYLWALLYGTIAMLTFASISMMFSVLFRNTLAAILASLGVLIISTLLQTFAFGIFDAWKPALFTYHMAQWQLLFIENINTTALIKSASILILHMAIAIAISIIRFNKMQITE